MHGNKSYTLNYAACSFINEKIKNNENYLSLNFTSLFYCPINKSILGKYKIFLKDNDVLNKDSVQAFVKSNNVKYILVSKLNSIGTSVGLDIMERKLNDKQSKILNNYLIYKKIVYEDKNSKIYSVN